MVISYILNFNYTGAILDVSIVSYKLRRQIKTLEKPIHTIFMTHCSLFGYQVLLLCHNFTKVEALSLKNGPALNS